MLSYYGKMSSQVYEIDKPVGYSFGDIEYYRERLKQVKGTILEPAVGTGRVYIPLRKEGFSVDGFDLSEEMVRICQQNCQSHGLKDQITIGNMVDFNLNKKYGAIIIPAGTFMLVHKREDSLKALENFYRHLQVGGRLILDMEIKPDILRESLVRTWDINGQESITLEMKTVEVDYVDQYTISYNRYEKWEGGILVKTELEKFPLRWYGLEEFKSILEHIGFKDVVFSQDYNYGKYPDNNYTSITVEAVK